MVNRSIMVGFLALFSTAVIVGAGCGTSAPVRLTELPRAVEMKASHTEPLRYSVAFAPVALEEELEKPEDLYAAAVKPDAGALRGELEQTLRDFEVFKELSIVDEEGEEKAFEAAKAKGADLLLTTTVKRYSVAYMHGARAAGTLIAWLISPWVSWLVGDEVYSADIGLNLALKKISDGSTLWEGKLDGKASCNLSDLQRGLKAHEFLIGSILTGPGSFNHKNYQKVASVVGPHAMQDLQLKLIDEMYKLPQPPPEKRSFAIVIGVNESRVHSLPKLEFAEADAASFAQLLKTGAPPPYEDDNVVALTGKEATIEALRKAVGDFKAKEYTEIVDFLVYFAGPGATADSKHWLAFTHSEDQNSMLSLEELYSLVEGVKAANRIIILDSGFAGVGSRGIVLSGGEVPSFEESLANSATIATISACGTNQGGHEFEKLGHGIFTARLLEALKGAADIDGDGAVTVEEAATYLEWPVERYVRDNTVGQSQKPTLICGEKAGRAVLFKLPGQ